jgi:hypothetical protein
MDDDTSVPWHQQPARALLAGIALLAVCAVCAVMWIGGGPGIFRAVGGMTGVAGTYFTVGGVMGLRDRSAS